MTEYDGPQHCRLDAHAKDNTQEEAFERIGLTVVRATEIDRGARWLRG